MRTNAIVVEIVRPSVAFSWLSNADSAGTSSGIPQRHLTILDAH